MPVPSKPHKHDEAADLGETSHDHAQESVGQGEHLPAYAILAERVRDPEGEELDWAKRRAEELNLP